MITRENFCRRMQEYVNKDYRRFGFNRPITYKQAKTYVEIVTRVIGLTMNDTDKLYLHQFGMFKHVIKKGRRVLHPVTGEDIYIPERDEVVFEPAPMFGVEPVKTEHPAEEDDDNYYD